MKQHCLINLAGKFDPPEFILRYIDKLEGDVITFTYARSHIDMMNKNEWDALHIYSNSNDKKYIRALANVITLLTFKPKEVYFLCEAKSFELQLIIREKWPAAKVFTSKQILT